MQARQEKLPGVANIVAVSSAKGGVGKSTVAVNLAIALRDLGRKVGLADVDIYGPSAPIMLGVNEVPVPDAEQRMMNPVSAHGLQVMSMGFLLDENSPAVWRGPVVMSATKQFLRGVAWGELDYLVIDMPPGTGDVALTLAQEVPLDGGLIVTTPQDVALADVTRGAAMFRRLNTPVLGVVGNMAGYICPDCGERDDLFGSLSAEEISAALGAPLLAEIPIVEQLREHGDRGTPLTVAAPNHPVSQAFQRLAVAVEEALAESSAAAAGPEPTRILHDEQAGVVKIEWSDGRETSYTVSGLRGWCPCAQCQGHGGETSFVPVDNPELVACEGVGRYALRFSWADGHSTGMYSYSYLLEIAELPECKG